MSGAPDGLHGPNIDASRSTSPPFSLFDPSRSRDELRKHVAQQTEQCCKIIDQGIDVLISLHSFHNSMAPVNALPVEVLGLIFGHLLSCGDLLPTPSLEHSQPHLRGDLRVEPPRGTRDVIRVTHVCWYWRVVGIRNPWLWASFPIHHPRGVQAFLARSRNLPISISLIRRFPSSAAPSLANSIHRIRSLHISTTLADDIELLWAELSQDSAPILEGLFIEHAKRNTWVSRDTVGRTVELPLIFYGHAPSLRILTLRGVPPLFDVFPATLVHLDFGAVRSLLPPFTDILAMLANCPLLETLNLRGSFEWDEFQDHVIVRNGVALPKLAKTCLRIEPMEAAGILLSSFSLPAHTDVSIFYKMDDLEDFAAILSSITPLVAPPCFRGFRRLHLLRERSNWRLQAYRDADAFLDAPALDVEVMNVFGGPDPEWSGFLYGWPFDASQIETLVMVYRREIPIENEEPGLISLDRTFDMWDATFRQLPALKTLRVMGFLQNEAEFVLETLRNHMPISSTMYCPGLTPLEMFDVDPELSDAALVHLTYVAFDRIPPEMDWSTLKEVVLFNCGFHKDYFLNIIDRGVELIYNEEVWKLGW
ncbi:hypothetical protein V8D89_003546 [Ganoderma adspersum]